MGNILLLDGPAKPYSLNVTTTTVLEVVKPTEIALSGRQAVSLQPFTSDIYVYFGDGTNVPSAATVAADGFKHFKNAMDTYEVGASQPLYILAVNTTTKVAVAERA